MFSSDCCERVHGCLYFRVIDVNQYIVSLNVFHSIMFTIRTQTLSRPRNSQPLCTHNASEANIAGKTGRAAGRDHSNNGLLPPLINSITPLCCLEMTSLGPLWRSLIQQMEEVLGSNESFSEVKVALAMWTRNWNKLWSALAEKERWGGRGLNVICMLIK